MPVPGLAVQPSQTVQPSRSLHQPGQAIVGIKLEPHTQHCCFTGTRWQALGVLRLARVVPGMLGLFGQGWVCIAPWVRRVGGPSVSSAALLRLFGLTVACTLQSGPLLVLACFAHGCFVVLACGLGSSFFACWAHTLRLLRMLPFRYPWPCFAC